MDKQNLTKVALRYRAVFLDITRERIDSHSKATAPVLAFVARLKGNGYCVSEELFHALNIVSPERLAEIVQCIDDVLGTKLNWASLVKGWNVPTGESSVDHLVTLFANILGGEKVGFKGTTLPCGHLIPDGTFPIERYNGCPFCGTPFETSDFVYKGQASKLKELRLFTVDDIRKVFNSLLLSATPLDGTQKDSLRILLREFDLPSTVKIAMKETAMLVVQLLVEQDKASKAQKFFKTPTDVLRYLWFEKTGYVQIIEPKTLVAHAQKLYRHMWGPLDRSSDAAMEMKKKLRLKYDRKACLRVALWLNNITMTAEQAAENTTVSPRRTVQEPFARCASFPAERDISLLPPMLIVTVVSGMIMPPFLDCRKNRKDHTGCTIILRRMRLRDPQFAESRYQIPEKTSARELIASEFHGEL